MISKCVFSIDIKCYGILRIFGSRPAMMFLHAIDERASCNIFVISMDGDHTFDIQIIDVGNQWLFVIWSLQAGRATCGMLL